MCWIAFLLAFVTPIGASGQSNPAVDAFAKAIDHTRSDLVATRHDFHRNPEVSGAEKRTASIIATKLESVGWTVRSRVGGYGVVATLTGALDGDRVVAFRADMDAVRSQDPDPVEYRSEIAGVRHICGHDIHTTIGIGLAEGFASIRSQFGGTIMLLFQPAEETASGANAMLADGVFQDTVPDAIFAVHTAPFETGQVATTPGGMMASRDRLTVTISGSGNIDEVADEVLRRIQSYNTVSPAQSFSGAPRESVFIRSQRPSRSGANAREVQATVMLADSDVRDHLVQQLRGSILTLDSNEVQVSLEYDRWIYGVTNDVDLTTRAVKVAEQMLGEANVIQLTQIVPAFSEDFGSFQEIAPGTMFFLGVSNQENGWIGMPHSPGYVADDEAIFVGARTMAAIMLDALDQE